MDNRHFERIRADINIRTNHLLDLLSRQSIIRRIRHVSKIILSSLNKRKIPFATVSTFFLFSNFTFAQTNHEFIRDIDIQSQSLTADGILAKAEKVIDVFLKIIEWFSNFKQNLYELSLKILSFVYETLSNIVLYTPQFLFNNQIVKSTTITFSLVSVSIVVLCSIYEGFMKMMKKSHTDMKTIAKHFPLAVAISGFTPFIFERGFELLNKLTKGITNLGSSIISSSTLGKETLNLSLLDVVGLFAFDLALIGFLIPILIQNGRRWWDLFCLSAISPLALSSWVFKRHRHLFDKWLKSIKKLSVIQLVYAIFVVLLSTFLYATRMIDNWFLKALVILGALYRMANPPQIIESYVGKEKDQEVKDVYRSLRKSKTDIQNLFKRATFHTLRTKFKR